MWSDIIWSITCRGWQISLDELSFAGANRDKHSTRKRCERGHAFQLQWFLSWSTWAKLPRDLGRGIVPDSSSYLAWTMKKTNHARLFFAGFQEFPSTSWVQSWALSATAALWFPSKLQHAVRANSGAPWLRIVSIHPRRFLSDTE